MVMLAGLPPAAIVPRAVRAPVVRLREYWETLLLEKFTTYTEAPSGEVVMPNGLLPAAIIPRAVRAPPLPSSTTDPAVPGRLTVSPTTNPVEVAD